MIYQRQFGSFFVTLFQSTTIASEDDEDIDSDMAFGESPGPSDKTKVGPGDTGANKWNNFAVYFCY